MGRKRIFAHRGLSQLAPENTLAAFNLLRQYGVVWLETDLDLTADNDIVILHDEDLDRTTNHTGPVHRLTRAMLAKVDAGSWFDKAYAGEPLPTLEQVIDVINRDALNVNFELKAHLANDPKRRDILIKGFSDALATVAPRSEVLVSSFSPAMLARFSELQPTVPTAVLFKATQLCEDWVAIAQQVGAVAVHPEVTGLTAGRVRDLKQAGLSVHVWTINSLSKAEELFSWGVDGIFTDISQTFSEQYAKQDQ